MAENMKNVSELEKHYIKNAYTLPQRLLRSLERTSGMEARQFIANYARTREHNLLRVKRWKQLLVYERRLWREGRKLIVGVDEVGVAPLAGPVLAAAVILPQKCRLLDVDDSKKLSEKQREMLALEIKAVALAWGVGFATPQEIDQINILQADYVAMKRALSSISARLQPDYVLVDYHTLPGVSVPQLGITDGDQKSLSIAAASIIAKTTRDAMMREYDSVYPGYDFVNNKGYGSQRHKAAILELGVLPIHRRTFKSVREALSNGVMIRE